MAGRFVSLGKRIFATSEIQMMMYHVFSSGETDEGLIMSLTKTNETNSSVSMALPLKCGNIALQGIL